MAERSKHARSLSPTSDGFPWRIPKATHMGRNYTTLPEELSTSTREAPEAAPCLPGPTIRAAQAGPDHPLTRATGCQLETVWAPKGVS